MSIQAPPELVELASILADAKRCEEQAKSDRLGAEKAITTLVGFEKPEGQETYEAESVLGRCKVVLKQPINTIVDQAEWPKIRRELPAKHPGRQVIASKFSVDAKRARKLQEQDKESWAKISACVSRKPGKIGVSISELEVATQGGD